MKALGPLAEGYGIGLDKLRPGLQNCFPWDPGGEPGLRGGAFWDYMNQRFTEIYAGLGLPEDLARDCAGRVRGIVLDPRSYRVRADAAATLAVCAYKGYRNYLLSNNFPELEEVLERLWLRRFFAGCVVSTAVGVNKPDVKIFRIAERVAKFPSLIWMVGDNPAADIRGAREAGWHTVYLAKAGAAHARAEITVDGLSEILRYL